MTQRLSNKEKVALEQLNAIQRFMKNGKVRSLNKALRIDGWSYISQFFFYIALFGVLLTIGSFFFIPYIFLWIYAIFVILLLGFVFAKPEQTYNFTLVIGVFMFLAFVPSNYMQMLLQMDDIDGDGLPFGNPLVIINGGDDLTNTLELEIEAYCGQAQDMKIAQSDYAVSPDWSSVDWRPYQNYITFQASEPVRDSIFIYVYFRGEGQYAVDSDTIVYDPNSTPDDDDDDDGIDLGEPSVEINGGDDKTNSLTIEVEVSCENADQMRYKMNDLQQQPSFGGFGQDEVEWSNYETTFTTTVEEPDPLHSGRKVIYLYVQFQRGDVIETAYDSIEYDEDFQENSTETGNIIEQMEEFANVNPLENPEEFGLQLAHLMNWIIFLAMVALGGSTIGDALTGQYGEIVKKGATIGITVVFITIIYTLFNMIDGLNLPTMFDTIGGAWNDLMGTLGFGQLNVNVNQYYYTQDVFNTGFRLTPLFLTGILGYMSYYYKDKDLKSILFVQSVSEETEIKVYPSGFSKWVLIFLGVMILYIMGYFLTSAEATVSINPFVSLAFYISAVIVLFLIASKVLILRTQDNWKEYAKSIGKWSLFGLFGLFAWFNLFQPIAYDMGMIDYESSLGMLSQDLSIFEQDFFTQFFLVATPETLVFQIFFVGLGCRLYFYLQKGKIQQEQKREIRKKMWIIANQYRNIPINPNSISKANLRRIAKREALKQKYEKLEAQINADKIQKVPLSYFILPALVSALIGSFFFSWYHSFRRGLSFIQFWLNPYLGLTYFGAGVLLSLVAFFCFPASIIIHALNNIIALLMMG